MTSPYERSILSHYWCSPEPWKGGYNNWLPLDVEIIHKFISAGLLLSPEFTPGIDRVMKNEDALRVYMDALDVVPLPVQKWMVPV